MADQDLSRPYVGYKSAGRRPESQQDRVASANAPLSALRGWLAGTLGLPGDIESVGRMLIPGVSNKSYIPDSEYFRKVLPMQSLQETPVGGAFTELGGLAGGAGLMTAAKAGKAGAKVVGQELNRAMLDSSGPLARLVPEAAKPMYAVKPKGGNWAPGMGPDMGKQDSVKASIQPLKVQGQGIFAGPFGPAEEATNKWLDTKLQSYIRNEMGTPNDPIRLAHEKGFSHFPGNPAEDYGQWLPERTAEMRLKAGFPEEGFAVQKYAEAGYPANMEANTRKAELWENLADTEITSTPAKSYQDQLRTSVDFPNRSINSFEDWVLTKQADENPWIKKLDPETPIYKIAKPSDLDTTLGFSHMTDELRNMLDPESGLPANLLLTPKKLENITVEQMVEKVDKVNKWRSEQAAKAEREGMIGNLTATPRLQDPTTQLSFVDKPGMTWVDIPATTDEKAKKLCTTIGKQAGWCTQGGSLATAYGSGENRLTTLLDAEGRPHVQAMLTAKGVEAPVDIKELKPVGNEFESDRALEYKKRDPQYQAKITESVLKFLNSGDWGKVKDLNHFNITDIEDSRSLTNSINDLFTDDFKKGVALFNQAIDLNPEAPRFMSRGQLRDFIDEFKEKPTEGFAKGGNVSAYNPIRIDEIMNSMRTPQNYAEGGSVSAYDPDQVDAIANQYM